MKVFIDSSAFFASLDVSDVRHRAAKREFDRLFGRRDDLVSTNYVVVETASLVQRRLGTGAVRSWSEKILPLVELRWIQPYQHQKAFERVLAESRRKLSLVDCTSFEVLAAEGIREVFAFDKHFQEAGFRCLPRS